MQKLTLLALIPMRGQGIILNMVVMTAWFLYIHNSRIVFCDTFAIQIEQKPKKSQPPRANSLPTTDDLGASSLRYVLPLQRAETIAKINLKRTRTVREPRERGITFEAAKDHWINAQLMKKEDEFVNWQKTK